jgi:hypothetical protein
MFCSKQVMIGSSKNIWEFDPRTIPNCALWLDPADTSTVTLNGSNVSQLRDKSGLGYNMSQATSGNQPTYSTSLNGNRMITFTQASSTRLSNVSFPAFIGAGAASYFLVEYNMTSASGNPAPFGYSAGPNFGLIYQYNPGNVVGGTNFISGFQPFRDVTTFDVAFYSPVPRISYLNIPNTGSGMVGFINGVSRSVGTQSAGTYSGTFSVGSGTNGFVSGNICELIVFNRSLTSSERQQVEGYLAQKWWVIPPTSSSFLPTSITGCELWLDGSDRSTMTFSGSNITQWNDKSGNARNTTSVTGTPTLTPLNNVQAIAFNGSSDFTGSIPGSGTALTVCIVGSRTAGSATNGGVVCFGRTGQPDWNDVGSLAITNGDSALRVMFSTRTANSQFAYIGSQTFMYILIFDGTNVNTFLNGGAISSAIANTGTFAFTEYKIANRAGNTGNFRHTGTIGEVVVFNSALTTTQRQQMEGYLANKWGLKTLLPVIQPYYPLKPYLQYFQPTGIAECELWFDGADYRTMFQDTAGTSNITATSQSVARWNDKVRGLAISNTGVLDQTMLAPTSASGGGVFFSNTSTVVSSNAQGLGTSLTNPFLFQMPNKNMTMVVASYPLSNDNLRKICSLGTYPFISEANIDLGLEMGAGNGGSILFDYNNGGAWGQVAVSSSGYNSNTVLRIDVLTADTTPLWSTNGTSNTFTTTNTYTTANSGYRVNYVAMGAYSSTIVGSRNFHGTVYEMILYSKVLTLSERQQIEGYLAWKWGLTASLPAAHAYKTIPTALTVPPIVNPLTLNGSTNVFVVKYDSTLTPLWARRMGGVSTNSGNSVTTDSSGNVIVAGQYVSNPLFNIYASDGSTIYFTLRAVSTTNVFVVKYNSSGTPLWARLMGCFDTTTNIARSVTTDSSGNVIVTGQYFQSPLNIFDAVGSGSLFQLSNPTSTIDIFVVKYDSSGTPLWARRMDGQSEDIAYSVTTDSSGNVIVAGMYVSFTLNIYAADGITVSFTLSRVSRDAFIVKYDSSGTPLWARKISGTGDDFAYSVITDLSGNIVVAGQYNSNPLNIYAANQTTVSLTLTGSGLVDTFVVKYDSSGTPLWARKISGTGNDYGYSVTTDLSGNIVVVGYYTSNPLNIYAADGTTVSFTLSNSGNNDVFVVKYDSSGTPLWARRMSGTSSTADDRANSVTTDLSGNIIVAGQYSQSSLNIFAADGSTVSFQLNNPTTNIDAFVVKYNSSGTPLLCNRIFGTGTDIANSVSTDLNGNIVVTGYYSSNPLSFYD